MASSGTWGAAQLAAAVVLDLSDDEPPTQRGRTTVCKGMLIELIN